ncbi:hypothetical protein I4F81_010538 [Pyropia yezoensis]|uniref:Uncharacterized protein n=1 Tax=Pyropia yezoensis TaxID=2788 RepID=A0ACC3CCZ7_PYRYE|nr:hypothetical protein I4F81_010538 [Neopyropia yezoensis]
MAGAADPPAAPAPAPTAEVSSTAAAGGAGGAGTPGAAAAAADRPGMAARAPAGTTAGAAAFARRVGGGVYIPPFKLARALAAEAAAEAAASAAAAKADADAAAAAGRPAPPPRAAPSGTPPAAQREAWEALKRRFNGAVNRVSAANLPAVTALVLRDNVVRGRGLLVRALLRAQVAAPEFTPVYASLAAGVNSRVPAFGALLGARVAVAVATDAGALLLDVAPRPFGDALARLRALLHDGRLNQRVAYLVEALLAARRDGFASHPPLAPHLDIVPDAEKVVHGVELGGELAVENRLNVFSIDPRYDEHEAAYAAFRRAALPLPGGRDDMTDGELVTFRRTVYLTIMSALSHEEAAHKLVALMAGQTGRDAELMNMLLECCTQERTYLRYYGLLGARFCLLGRGYQAAAEAAFATSYAGAHHLDTRKLRNVGNFFAAMLHADALPWRVFGLVRLVESETTSSTRILLKIIFQSLASARSIAGLTAALHAPDLAPHVAGLFPTEDAESAAFAINYWTFIGLGAVAEDLPPTAPWTTRERGRVTVPLGAGGTAMGGEGGPLGPVPPTRRPTAAATATRRRPPPPLAGHPRLVPACRRPAGAAAAAVAAAVAGGART